MAALFRDKETEHNWDSREKAITRLRGILRGDASEKYLDTLMAGIRQMVDGIIKSVESLRTTLALNALSLIADIGVYLGRHLTKPSEVYIYDQLIRCLFGCASSSKKIMASASMTTCVIFIRHAAFYHKMIQMLSLSMNEKNNQVRQYTVIYIKNLLQAHAGKEHTRAVMNRTGGTDMVEKILIKGVTDATPAVREVCREAFWIFWEHWKDRGEAMLRSFDASVRKALEKSKATALAKNRATPTDAHRNVYSPTNSSGSLRASSSLGSHRLIPDTHDTVSPSTSSASNGSTGSAEPHSHPYHEISRTITRSASPSIRSTSPHPLRSYGSPPSFPAQVYSSHAPPVSPPPARKTRVPALHRKKSTMGLNAKRKPSLMAMLTHDDLAMRCESVSVLARKLAAYPYQPQPDLHAIQLESSHGPLDGEALKRMVWDMFTKDHVQIYEAFASWDGLAGVLLKLVTFEELVPRLMLDATMDEVARKTEDDIVRYNAANLSLQRIKLFLSRHDAQLAERLLINLQNIMNGVSDPSLARRPTAMGIKKDPAKNPANRRKLTMQFVLWMDELVTPVIGLDTPIEEDTSNEAQAWLGDAGNIATTWFESDAHVRHYLNTLLPILSTSTPGTIFHAPLVALVGHLRLINQKLFEVLANTLDDAVMSKVSKLLGIHLRVIPDYVCQAAPDFGQLDEEAIPAMEEPSTPLSPQEHDPAVEPAIVSDPITNQHVTDGSFVDDLNDNMGEEHIHEPIPNQPTASESITDEPIVSGTAVSEFVINESFPVDEQEPESFSISAVTAEPSTRTMKNSQQQGSTAVWQASAQGQHDTESDPVTVAPVQAEIDRNETKELQPSHDDYSVPDITEPTVEDYAPIHAAEHPTDSIYKTSAPATAPKISPENKVDLATIEPSPLQDMERERFGNPYVTRELVGHDSGKSDHRMDRSVGLATTHPQHMTRESPYRAHEVSELHAMEGATKLSSQQNGVHVQDVATPTDILNAAPSHLVSPTSMQPSVPTTLSSASHEDEPLPAFVDYYQPERVIDALPVFEKNHRSQPSTGAHLRGGRDRATVLYGLVDKLKSMEADSMTFRKLMRLSRETPILKRWDMGGSEENGNDAWAGADHNGGNFVELVQVITAYVGQDHASVLPGLELIQQLAVAQTGLFRFYEKKVNSQGMSLEAQLVQRLLELRSNDNPTISTLAEDALDAVLGAFDAQTVFDVLLCYLIYRFVLSPCDTWNSARYHPIGTAFTYIGKWVKEVNNTFFLDEWLTQGGSMVLRKGMNDSMIHIRKSCVEAIVAFQEALGDDIYRFLQDLREDQKNLVRHYVAKSVKKKASLRNLSVSGQLR
ncbi:clasp N terminal-domain-containing protein [Radiomyces spectabilis]|uniref:clasp N terminal-domain-containing protein n=1 Tax=Radiomyces spectabilis TaxID=64574 RepID=UPI00221EE8B9|nr:clasp N terminal-domain-containing protein [Radiomyces spectabilis]KAI8384234.1 clasp N terminal-domain-containing protein [Radiomyces spectabilis]